MGGSDRVRLCAYWIQRGPLRYHGWLSTTALLVWAFGGVIGQTISEVGVIRNTTGTRAFSLVAT